MFLAWKNFQIHIPSLASFLKTNIPYADGIVADANGMIIVENTPFTQTDIDAINGYYDALTSEGENTKFQNETTSNNLRTVIKNASVFGQGLIIDFIAENLSMGITQAGKTGAVTDYLHKLAHYISTGSLYQAITEIDSKIAEGIPQDLAPFVTEERLLTYRDHIASYLGI